MDRPRIARIVRNLLSNAIEYAQRAPVDVLVGSNKRGVAVMVRDYGQGMTAQQAERVFDRFWRGDVARTRTMGGTGLGARDREGGRAAARRHARGVGVAGTRREFPSDAADESSGSLGQRPVIPLVAREREFARLGEPVSLEQASSGGDVVRARAALAALAAAALLAGCAGIPSSGEVKSGGGHPIVADPLDPVAPVPGSDVTTRSRSRITSSRRARRACRARSRPPRRTSRTRPRACGIRRRR